MDISMINVKAFHNAFGAKVGDRPNVGNPSPDELVLIQSYAERMARVAVDLHRDAGNHKSELLLRLQLCQEELAELAQALADQDLVECLDALCDMRYVADGTTLSLGLAPVFMSAFAAVHRSNMSKLDADGNPVIDPAGRVVKGPNYARPDLRRYVR